MIKIFKKGWLTFVTILVTFTLIGFFLSYNYCKDPGSKLIINFKYTENFNIDIDDFTKEDNINKVKALEYSMYTGNSVSTYKDANIKSITASVIDDYYQIKVNSDAFNKTDGTRNEATAKGFMRNLTLVVVSDYVDLSLYPDEIVDKGDYKVTIKGVSKLFDVDFYNANSLNSSGNLIFEESNYDRNGKIILFTSIGAITGLVLGLTLTILLGIKYKDRLDNDNIYDNERLFKTPFHKKYWVLASQEFKSVKKLVIMALLLALTLTSKLIKIPSGFGSVGFGFGLIFLSVATMISGPIAGLVLGALSDILGFFLFEANGAFNPIFTLSAMLASFTYGIMFYRTKISYTRCLIARIVINFILNIFLEGIGQMIVYDYTFDWLLFTSLPKQVAFLVPQSLIMYIVLAIVAPIASQTNFIEEEVGENISIF